MTTFKADSTVLTKQATIHQNLANFYQHAYDRLTAQSTHVIHAFNGAERHDDAAAYTTWMANLERLKDEASAHQDWANYFTQLAENVQSAEEIFDE